MHNALVEFLNSQQNNIDFLINVLLQSLFFTIGLTLWNKVAFPFKWRRVWSFFFFILGTLKFFTFYKLILAKSLC
jgi:hypothetical protein